VAGGIGGKSVAKRAKVAAAGGWRNGSAMASGGAEIMAAAMAWHQAMAAACWRAASQINGAYGNGG